MKHLKSSLKDLRKLFESIITVRDIAEPFTSFDADSCVTHVKQFMDDKDYDIIGVRRDGLVSGFAIKHDLLGRKLEEHLKPFDEEDLLDDKAPLKEVFEKLEHKSHLFIIILEQVGGIVTRGDLQKVPVRMWLFGLISLIEMQLLRIIKEYFPYDEWKSLVKKTRLDAAEKMCEERRYDDTNIGLADCLQFADKYTIILKDNKLWNSLSLGPSKKSYRRFFGDLRKIRDRLAHVQNIITGKWEEVNNLVKHAEQLLEKLEQFSIA